MIKSHYERGIRTMNRRTEAVPDFSRETTLAEALSLVQTEFPLVVRTCDSCDVYELTDEAAGSLPARALIKLEKVVTVSYALVRVLPLSDEEAARAERGEEFVEDYSKITDQEVLIPLNVPHKVKVVHRPQRRLRYAAVEQVLQDRPRYLRVEIDTLVSQSSENDGAQLIAAGTVLEVKRVLPKQYENRDCLECMDTKTKERFLFNQDEKVNFTAVPDTKTYTLPLLVSSVLLPVILKFAVVVEPNDVVFFDDNQAKIMLTLTHGLLEVIKCESKSFVMGLMRNNTRDAVPGSRKEAIQKVVLISEDALDSVEVQIKNFRTDNHKQRYCDNNFKTCNNLDFIEKKLYFVRPDTKCCVVLRSDEEDCVSEEGLQDYLEPVNMAPPLPPRCPLKTAETKQTQTEAQFSSVQLPKKNIRQDVLQKILDRTKLGFGKVHKELMARVQKSRELLKNTNLVPSPVKSKLARASSHEDCVLRQPHRRNVLQRSVSESDTDWLISKNACRGRPLPPLPKEPDS